MSPFKSKKKQKDPLNDIEFLDIDKVVAMEKVQFADILRYILLQITKARAIDHTPAYLNLVGNLKACLTPYQDKLYKDEIVAIEKEIILRRDKISPNLRWKAESSLEIEATDMVYVALVKLLERQGFLADKAFSN